MRRGAWVRRAVGRTASCALLLAALGYGQSLAEDKTGQIDPAQLQRDRELMELNPAEKPKPEVEVLTPLDPATTSPKDIVIVPDEPDKPPSRSVKDKDEPPKKKDDY